MPFGKTDGNPVPLPADTTAGLGILEAFGSWLGMRLILGLQITYLGMPEIPWGTFSRIQLYSFSESLFKIQIPGE